MTDEVMRTSEPKSPKIPKLYRYRKAQYALPEIKENYVFAICPSDFNDPYDSSFCANCKEIEEIWKNDDDGPRTEESSKFFFSEMTESEKKNYRNGLEYVLGTLGVVSFTENFNSMIMWSHYGDCHTGVCIEYDFNACADKNIRPMKVNYSDRLISSKDIRTEDRKDLPLLAALNKNAEWKYENEWRIVIKNPSDPKIDVTGSITHVYLGANAWKNNERSSIVDFCKNKGIPLDDVVLSKREYKMITKENEDAYWVM